MCFRETKRYVYEKDLFYLHETKNYVYLVVLNKAQKNKETLSLFVLCIRDVITDVLRCRCFRWRSSLFPSWTSSNNGNYLVSNFSRLHTMVFVFSQDLSNISSDIVRCYICVDLMDFTKNCDSLKIEHAIRPAFVIDLSKVDYTVTGTVDYK